METRSLSRPLATKPEEARAIGAFDGRGSKAVRNDDRAVRFGTPRSCARKFSRGFECEPGGDFGARELDVGAGPDCRQRWPFVSQSRKPEIKANIGTRRRLLVNFD